MNWKTPRIKKNPLFILYSAYVLIVTWVNIKSLKIIELFGVDLETASSTRRGN